MVSTAISMTLGTMCIMFEWVMMKSFSRLKVRGKDHIVKCVCVYNSANDMQWHTLQWCGIKAHLTLVL